MAVSDSIRLYAEVVVVRPPTPFWEISISTDIATYPMDHARDGVSQGYGWAGVPFSRVVPATYGYVKLSGRPPRLLYPFLVAYGS